MAHPQLTGEIHVAGHGEHTSRSHDPPVPDDDSAIVKRGLVPEYILQKLRVDGTVQARSRADRLVQHIFPFKNHQRAGLTFREGSIGFHCLGDGVLQLIGYTSVAGKHLSNVAAAHLLQQLTKLRLKKDYQRQNAPFQQSADKKVYRIQVENNGQPQGANDQ